jgi:Helicase conserved C-terminal domain
MPFLQLQPFQCRVILVTATQPRELELSNMFPGADITLVEWQRNKVVDHDGRLLDATPRPILYESACGLTPPELSLEEAVRRLCLVFEGSGRQQGWITQSILRSLESSPPALERALRGLSEGLVNVDLKQLPELIDDEAAENYSALQISDPTANKAPEEIGRVLEEIEEIATDSKLDKFCKLLSCILETQSPTRRICVVTDYTATLFYLAAGIEALGITCLILNGAMNDVDRHRALHSFSNSPGVLVATRAVLTEGVSLGEVSDLVLYDIPGSQIALDQILGRFDRFGRKTQLKVHAFAPSNSFAGQGRERLRFLQKTFGSGRETQ